MENIRKIAIIVVLFLCLSLIQLPSASAGEICICGINVSSDGTVAVGPVLEVGKRYRIEAKTIFWYDYSENLAADAQYYTTDGSNCWQWTNWFKPDAHSFLQVDGMDVDWGPFSNGDTWHTYSIFYIGKGMPITFQIKDWVDNNYTNNNCHINVYIYESPEERYQGLTPGFWKNHLNAWEGYSPSDKLDTVFTNEGTGVDLSQYTLLQALKFKGGPGVTGAEQILLRAAVAALLNAAASEINYPLTTADVITQVNEALASDNRATILELASQLDSNNNLGL